MCNNTLGNISVFFFFNHSDTHNKYEIDSNLFEKKVEYTNKKLIAKYSTIERNVKGEIWYSNGISIR